MAAYLSSYLLAPLVKEAILAAGLTASSGNHIMDDAQRALRTAEEAVRALIDKPGAGLGGQQTIPREKFTRELASFYSNIFPNHHIVVLYDRLPRLLHLHGVIASDGRIDEGFTSGEIITAHKKIERGYMKMGLWGFDMYVFREGRIKNLGDGGYANWAWKSKKWERKGMEVEFKLIEDEGEVVSDK